MSTKIAYFITALLIAAVLFFGCESTKTNDALEKGNSITEEAAVTLTKEEPVPSVTV